jgi:hypothetical protein
MEDRLIELEAMQKVLLEGVGQLNPAATFTRQEKKNPAATLPTRSSLNELSMHNCV